MIAVELEHANLTVSDPKKTAENLCKLFDWKIRWRGAAINGDGPHRTRSAADSTYLALYCPALKPQKQAGSSYATAAGLNHVAVVVDDIDAMELRVKQAGYEPVNHGDYTPGRRFYFHNEDGIEIEVVSYAT